MWLRSTQSPVLGSVLVRETAALAFVPRDSIQLQQILFRTVDSPFQSFKKLIDYHHPAPLNFPADSDDVALLGICSITSENPVCLL